MIYGFDVSHWNGNNAIEKGIYRCPDKAEFCFIKATEGSSYKDMSCDINVTDANNKGLQIGLYHYARPERNTVLLEVSNFMSVYNKYKDELNIIPILDWEGKALECNEEWAIQWLTSVHELTRIKPIFYCQQSALKKYDGIAMVNFPLWVARYRKFELGVGHIEPFKKCHFWQFTSTPMDFSVFYGTKKELQDMFKRKEDTSNEDYDECGCHHCGCSCCRDKE